LCKFPSVLLLLFFNFFFPFSLSFKLDGEAGQVVFRACKQTEGAAMSCKDVADEQQT
jgi:hypothetical protein